MADQSSYSSSEAESVDYSFVSDDGDKSYIPLTDNSSDTDPESENECIPATPIKKTKKKALRRLLSPANPLSGPSHSTSSGSSHAPLSSPGPTSHSTSSGPSRAPLSSPGPSHSASSGPNHASLSSPGPSHSASSGPSHAPLSSPGPTSHSTSSGPCRAPLSSPGPSHSASSGPSHAPLSSPGPSHSTSSGPIHAIAMVTTEPNETSVITTTPGSSKKLTRKRQRQPESWKCIKRQKHKEAGEAYISMRKKEVPAKKIVDRHQDSCKFQCDKKISVEERQEIHDNFYTLSFEGKHSFILSTTECHEKKNTSTMAPSRRLQSLTYTLKVNGHCIRVCKTYYLDTLAVSQKMIYSSHKNKNPVTGTPGKDGRGKHFKKKTTDEAKARVIDHINSFPRIESHYCRSTTKKEYVESGLNLQKMYDLYVDHMIELEHDPVKVSYYRRIFNYEFNIDFHSRKTDRCDLCESVDVAKSQNFLTTEEEDRYNSHVANKCAMRTEYKNDQEDCNVDVIISFDLENVISLPRADISSFFYKRKLNVYNLTGYDSKMKQGYCVIWPENLSGRTGNDIASAFIKILEKVVESNENITKIVTWSDSCVPQNRNSIMTYAIYQFLVNHPHIESVTMKFSVPGHSCVQSVDNMHSQIEKVLSSNEVFSPISLLRLLLKVNRKKPYKIIQMKEIDFKDFKSASSYFDFQSVPFSKISVIKVLNEPKVLIKTSHAESDFQTISIRKPIKTRGKSIKRAPVTEVFLPELKVAKTLTPLSKDKVSDLKDMLKFMSQIDKQFYQSILKN